MKNLLRNKKVLAALGLGLVAFVYLRSRSSSTGIVGTTDPTAGTSTDGTSAGADTSGAAVDPTGAFTDQSAQNAQDIANLQSGFEALAQAQQQLSDASSLGTPSWLTDFLNSGAVSGPADGSGSTDGTGTSSGTPASTRPATSARRVSSIVTKVLPSGAILRTNTGTGVTTEQAPGKTPYVVSRTSPVSSPTPTRNVPSSPLPQVAAPAPTPTFAVLSASAPAAKAALAEHRAPPGGF